MLCVASGTLALPWDPAGALRLAWVSGAETGAAPAHSVWGAYMRPLRRVSLGAARPARQEGRFKTPTNFARALSERTLSIII